MALTEFLLPTYAQMLRAMSGWLDKAEKQLSPGDAEALLSARIAPDMFPLATQIRFSCLQAMEAACRLRGEALPERLEALAAEGRNAGDRPGTIADALAWIEEALSLLESLAPGALDARASDPLVLALPNGMIFDMTGDQYARDWALPQFYFHLVMAYAILRNRGVDIGKPDYVPHMFPYIRPGTMPQGE